MRSLSSAVDANRAATSALPLISTKDAEKRVLQSPDAIPADSEAGRAALAKGGEAAKNVEIPGVATTAAVGSGTGVGRFFETQSSKGGRYTVTLPNGTKVEEVNKVTAAQMVPFDNIQFTGNYGNMTEISIRRRNARRRKGRSTTTSPASGRNAAATSPSAPICTNNRCWLAKKAAHCRLFIFIPAIAWPRTLRKIPRLSAILHFMRFRKINILEQPFSPRECNGKETGPERPDRHGP